MLESFDTHGAHIVMATLKLWSRSTLSVDLRLHGVVVQPLTSALLSCWLVDEYHPQMVEDVLTERLQQCPFRDLPQDLQHGCYL